MEIHYPCKGLNNFSLVLENFFMDEEWKGKVRAAKIEKDWEKYAESNRMCSKPQEQVISVRVGDNNNILGVLLIWGGKLISRQFIKTRNIQGFGA